MKRTQPPLKLHNSPLVMVLAQVRISPVARIGDYVPDIQEQLRKQGFPRFVEGNAQEVVLSPGQPPQVRTHRRWEFQNAERTTGIIASPNAVVLHTNNYATFDEFANQLELALRVFGEVVQPALVERLGLRYVDIIQAANGESWRDYLKQGLHGLGTESMEVANRLHRSETVGTTPIGKIVVRCMQTRDGTFLPPDLAPSTLNYERMNVGVGDLVTFLDLDHYSEESRGFDPDTTMSTMWELHDVLDVAFRASVTDHAMDRWKAQRR